MGHSIPLFAFRIDCERGRHFGPKGRRAREQSGADVEKRSRSLDSVVEPTTSSVEGRQWIVQQQSGQIFALLEAARRMQYNACTRPQAKDRAVVRLGDAYGSE